MRIFVTGASGWIGSAVTTDLLVAGHQVLGLARSDESADAVDELGAQVHRGSLDDADSLRTGAAACDGVVHLGYNHNFSDMAGAAVTDRAAIEALGSALSGTGRPLVVAAGVLGLSPGTLATEQDQADPAMHPRIANVAKAVALSDHGIRSVAVRFAPTVHGTGDHGFIATIVGIAREKGASAYIGDGSNHWPAVHRLDAAHLVRLAVESAPGGTSLHAVAEQGVPTRAIAEAIGAGLGLPVVSVSPEDTAEHFGWMGAFFGMNSRASSMITRKLLGWNPTHPTLLEDLAEGSYFRTV
jgi:nucleoside-diphosphate-sugar epimerase